MMIIITSYDLLLHTFRVMRILECGRGASLPPGPRGSITDEWVGIIFSYFTAPTTTLVMSILGDSPERKKEIE